MLRRNGAGPRSRTRRPAILKLLRGRATGLQVLPDGPLAYCRVGRVGSPVEDLGIGEVVRDVAALLAPPPGFWVACEGEMPRLVLLDLRYAASPQTRNRPISPGMPPGYSSTRAARRKPRGFSSRSQRR